LSRFTSVIRLMAVILCEEFSPVGMNATNTSRIRWDRQQRRSDSSFVVDPIQKFNEPLAIDPKQDFIILDHSLEVFDSHHQKRIRRISKPYR
jgi:hypothetical protein